MKKIASVLVVALSLTVIAGTSDDALSAEKVFRAGASAVEAAGRRPPGRAPKVHSAAACSCEPQWLQAAPFGPATRAQRRT